MCFGRSLYYHDCANKCVEKAALVDYSSFVDGVDCGHRRLGCYPDGSLYPWPTDHEGPYIQEEADYPSCPNCRTEAPAWPVGVPRPDPDPERDPSYKKHAKEKKKKSSSSNSSKKPKDSDKSKRSGGGSGKGSSSASKSRG